jgi:HEPN domain-containing protein
MNRNDFQKISNLRVKEAKTLLDRRFFCGSYYLLGYAVECALKACIARNTDKFDFPPNPKQVRNIYTHDIETLLRASGLEQEREIEIKNNPGFEANWSTVKDWKEDSRYKNDIDELTSKDFYSAVTARKNGVLSWLKKYW